MLPPPSLQSLSHHAEQIEAHSGFEHDLEGLDLSEPSVIGSDNNISVESEASSDSEESDLSAVIEKIFVDAGCSPREPMTSCEAACSPRTSLTRSVACSPMTPNVRESACSPIRSELAPEPTIAELYEELQISDDSNPFVFQ